MKKLSAILPAIYDYDEYTNHLETHKHFQKSELCLQVNLIKSAS